MNEDAAQLRESLATYQVQLQQVRYDKLSNAFVTRTFDGYYLELLTYLYGNRWKQL